MLVLTKDERWFCNLLPLKGYKKKEKGQRRG
jgi:hypothetical protein